MQALGTYGDKKTTTQTLLINGTDETTPPTNSVYMALETISSYPEYTINTYTDGSAVWAIRNGGYGSIVNAPDLEEPILLSGPCGAHCTNNEAIQKTLDIILQHIGDGKIEERTFINNLIIF